MINFIIRQYITSFYIFLPKSIPKAMNQSNK
jgi:hypothetical protein